LDQVQHYVAWAGTPLADLLKDDLVKEGKKSASFDKQHFASSEQLLGTWRNPNDCSKEQRAGISSH
jgi:hypothetical protein